MRQMATRMESTEMRQQQIMAFLARAVNNPAFLQQLLSARQNQHALDNKGTLRAKLLWCARQVLSQRISRRGSPVYKLLKPPGIAGLFHMCSSSCSVLR